MYVINDYFKSKYLDPLRCFVKFVLLFSLTCSYLAVAVASSNAGVNTSVQDKASAYEVGYTRLSRQEINPAHVYQLTVFVRSQINAIHRALGKTRVDALSIKYSNVMPREVFFQARALNEGTFELDYEWNRSHRESLPNPQKEIVPGDVYAEIYSAGEILSRVEARLGIDTVHKISALDPSKTPSDVFASVVAANREINNLLTRQFSPSDVFEQVTVALNYANHLRQKTSGKQVPEAPLFAANKSPAEVFQKLLVCFQILQRISSLLQIDMLEVNMPGQIGEINPADLYSLALMLVAELYNINFFRDGKVVSPIAYYPGKLTPSFVFQRVGLLERQLLVLESIYAKSDPR